MSTPRHRRARLAVAGDDRGGAGDDPIERVWVWATNVTDIAKRIRANRAKAQSLTSADLLVVVEALELSSVALEVVSGGPGSSDVGPLLADLDRVLASLEGLDDSP